MFCLPTAAQFAAARLAAAFALEQSLGAQALGIVSAHLRDGFVPSLDCFAIVECGQLGEHDRVTRCRQWWQLADLTVFGDGLGQSSASPSRGHQLNEDRTVAPMTQASRSSNSATES